MRREAHRLVRRRNWCVLPGGQRAEGGCDGLDGVIRLHMAENLDLDRPRRQHRRPGGAKRLGRQPFDLGARWGAIAHILVVQQPVEVPAQHRVGRTRHGVIGDDRARLDATDWRRVPARRGQLGGEQPQLVLVIRRPRDRLQFKGVVIDGKFHAHAAADGQFVQFPLPQLADAARHQRVPAGPAGHGLVGGKGLLPMAEADVDPHLLGLGIIGEEGQLDPVGKADRFHARQPHCGAGHHRARRAELGQVIHGHRLVGQARIRRRLDRRRDRRRKPLSKARLDLAGHQHRPEDAGREEPARRIQYLLRRHGGLAGAENLHCCLRTDRRFANIDRAYQIGRLLGARLCRGIFDLDRQRRVHLRIFPVNLRLAGRGCLGVLDNGAHIVQRLLPIVIAGDDGQERAVG